MAQNPTLSLVMFVVSSHKVNMQHCNDIDVFLISQNKSLRSFKTTLNLTSVQFESRKTADKRLSHCNNWLI